MGQWAALYRSVEDYTLPQLIGLFGILRRQRGITSIVRLERGSIAVDLTVKSAGDDANDPDPVDGEEVEQIINQQLCLPLTTK